MSKALFIQPSKGIPYFRRRLFSFYAALVFLLVYLLLFPFFWLFLQSKKTKLYAHNCNRIWARVVFFLCGIQFKPEWEFQPNFEPAVYCANHTSFVDIPTIYYATKGSLSFIGKSSLGKVPLFGYMYSRLHLLVDRKNPKSRVEVYEKSLQLIDERTSIAVFPEGTISKNGIPPQLLEFKDGAFKLAIEKQIPLIPVTIAYNWIILRDDGKWLPKIHPCKVVFHKPIETKGLNLSHVQELKKLTYQIIQKRFQLENGVNTES